MLKLRSIPYWLFFLAAVAGIYGLSLLAPEDAAMVAKLQVDAPAKATLDALQEATKLVATLDTTMLAASAALIVKGKDWTSAWSRVDGFLLLSAFLSGAVSYYGQYMAMIDTLSMIATGYLNPLSTRLQFAIAMQYDALIFGVLLLGIVFARMMEGRSSAKKGDG